MFNLGHEELLLIMVLSIGVFIAFLVFAVLFIVENNKYLPKNQTESETVVGFEEMSEPEKLPVSETSSVDQKVNQYEDVFHQGENNKFMIKPKKEKLLKNYQSKEQAESSRNALDPKEETYTALKTKYDIIIEQANSDIETIKSELQKKLNMETAELAHVRAQLIRLEINLNTGRGVGLNKHMQMKALITKEKHIGNTILELKSLINSYNSTDIISGNKSKDFKKF